MSEWWLLPAFVGGAIFGFLLMAIIIGDDKDDRK